MSTKTTFKRIALVAVAALSFGLLTSVSPASAADSAAVGPINSGQTTVRTDDTVYDDTVGGTGTAFGLSSTEGTANDFDGAKVKVTYQANSSAAETIISTVAGAAPSAAGSDTVSLGTGVQLVFDNGTTGTNTFGTPASGVYTIAGSADSAAANVIYLNFGRNATPGLYKLWIDGNADGDWADATGTDDTGTFMIADMPNSVRIRDAVSLGTEATRVGNGTLTYNVQVRDAGGRDSYLLGTERVRFAVTGGTGAGLTITTPALPTIGSGDLGTTATSRRFSLTATAASAAGTYTLTGTMEGFASTWATTAGSATAVITSDASVVSAATGLYLTSTGCSPDADEWTGFGVCAADTTSTTASTGTASDTLSEVVAAAGIVKNYLPTTQRVITLQARFATTTTGDAKFTVVNGNVSGIYDGPANRVVPIVSGALYNTATITYTADYANADEFALFSIAAASDVMELAVVYKNPVPGYTEISDPAAANVRAAAGSTNVYSVTVYSQFGELMGNQPVTFTTSASSRNASASITAVTDATGVAKFTLADTYVGVDGRTTDVITATAVNGTGSNSYHVATMNVVYGLLDTGSMTLAVAQPATPGNTATYDTTITTAAAPAVTIDDTPDSTNNNSAQLRIADQILLTGTVYTAAGSPIQGQPVVVTGTDGVVFNACSATVGEVSTTLTGKRTTRTCYANSSGQVNVQAAFLTSGVATITLTSGTVVKTYKILVNSGTARLLTTTTSGKTVTAKVTDLRGNPVSGVAVSFNASGDGRFGNGLNASSANTDASGVVSYDVFGLTAGNVTVSTSIASTTETAKLADATYGLPAGARTGSVTLDVSESASQSAAQAAADAAAEATDAANAATDAANAAAEAADAATAAAQDAADAVAALSTQVSSAIDALKKQIVALTNLVIKIQKKVKA